MLSAQIVSHVLLPYLSPRDLCVLECTCMTLKSSITEMVWFRKYMSLWPSCTHPFSSSAEEAPQVEDETFDAMEEYSWKLWFGSSVNWKKATCLRFSLSDAPFKETLRNDVQQALTLPLTNLKLCNLLESIVSREKIVSQHLTTSRGMVEELKKMGVDVFLVGSQYVNQSSSSISGVCNFYLNSCVAFYFPQSAFPLVFSYSCSASGYNDDPDIYGELHASGFQDICLWWSDYRNVQHLWLNPYVSCALMNDPRSLALTPFRLLHGSSTSSPLSSFRPQERWIMPTLEKNTFGGFLKPLIPSGLIDFRHHFPSGTENVKILLNGLDQKIIQLMYENSTTQSLLIAAISCCEACRGLRDGLSWGAKCAIYREFQNKNCF